MSLKIEGRMKQPAYTAGVTAVYRKYLDMYLSGKEYHVQEKTGSIFLSFSVVEDPAKDTMICIADRK